MIVRAINQHDYQAYVKLAEAAGVGMTSLTTNKAISRLNFEKALNSFQKKVTHPKDELYLFVLEDPQTKEIGGISGIYAKTENMRYYRVETRAHYKILHPFKRVDGPSELCSLFILPHFRQAGFGKLLSFSRFLFIASFKERFTKTIFAELRGRIENNNSSFWNSLGKKLLPVSFRELNLELHGEKNTLEESVSQYPIYSFLLSKKAEQCIGKTHTQSQTALHLLLGQGFQVTDLINPNDGGPLIEASIEEIKTVNKSEEGLLSEIKHFNEEEDFFVSKPSLNFKSIVCKLKKEQDKIILTPESAKLLDLNVGDPLRFIPKRMTL